MTSTSITGGIVLCGGQSRRLGQSKPALRFGEESMLGRVVRLVAEAVDPVVVAASPNQPLPPLPESVRVVYDRRPDCGPLGGLAAALAALDGRADRVFVTAGDRPLLKPLLIRRLVELADASEAEAVVPHLGSFAQPLAAIYRCSVLRHVEVLLDEAESRLADLLDRVTLQRVPPEQLKPADPRLDSFTDVGSPMDYRRALAKAGML